MTEDRAGDLPSVYLAGREAGATRAEELCRERPDLLPELRQPGAIAFINYAHQIRLTSR